MNSTKSYSLSVFMVFMGAVFWSLNAPLVKYVHMDPILVCGLRSLIAGLTLSPFIRFEKLHFNRWLVLYLLSYTSLCVGIIFALSMTSATIAIGMQYSSVIWIFLFEWLFRGDLIKKRFFSVGLITIGVVFFMISGGSSGTSLGNLIAFTEGISFVGITVCGKKAGAENPLGVTALANLFCSAFTSCFQSFSLAGIQLITTQNWLILFLLGVVQIGLGYSFYNIGIKRVPPQKASIIAIWEMILGPVWVALLIGEIPSAIVVIGFVLIIAGIFIDTMITPASF